MPAPFYSALSVYFYFEGPFIYSSQSKLSKQKTAGRREFRNLVFSAVNLWPGKIASLNPEVGQNTALHVSRTATNFRCSIFLPYVHSTSFFSKPFPVKHKATCDQSSESAFTCVLMIVFRSCIVSAAALSPVNHKGLFQG